MITIFVRIFQPSNFEPRQVAQHSESIESGETRSAWVAAFMAK